MSQSNHLSSEFYNFYDMEKSKTHPDLFASERESDPVSYQIQYKFPLTPMGVLAPGSAHARPSAQPPIDVSGNFSAHMSAE